LYYSKSTGLKNLRKQVDLIGHVRFNVVDPFQNSLHRNDAPIHNKKPLQQGWKG